jgi:hypothetical protein
VQKFIRRHARDAIHAVSILKDPASDFAFLEFLQSIISKTYKKKSSGTIIDYSQGKHAFLDAMVGHCESWKKRHLIPKIQGIKSSIVN